MNRVPAVLLALALGLVQGRFTPLHVHSYDDHEHAEHRHGLAAHEHQRSSPRSHEGPGLEPCRPGQHTVAVFTGCVPAAPAPVMDAGGARAPLVTAPRALLAAVLRTEVRAHGPPALGDVPPRAPPVHILL